jgi:hypothetical protein
MTTLLQPYTENFEAIICRANASRKHRCRESNGAEHGARPQPSMSNMSGLSFKNLEVSLEDHERPDSAGESLYTVHLRYARRKREGERVQTDPVKPEELVTLLDWCRKWLRVKTKCLDFTLN